MGKRAVWSAVLFAWVSLAVSVQAEQVKTRFNSCTGCSDFITKLDSTTLPSGSTVYVQTNPASQQSTAFNTSSGTVGTQLNVNHIHFNGTSSMVTYPDNTSILSMPDTNSMYCGYNGNVLNSGGTFNNSSGPGAMPFPWTANFMNCFGASCMGNNLMSGQNSNGMGYGNLANCTSCSFDNCMGGSTCQAVTSAFGLSCVGSLACASDSISDNLAALGFRALFWATSPNMIGVGFEAGSGTSTTFGENAAVRITHGMFLGEKTGLSVSSTTILDNVVAIGQKATVSSSNTMQLGGIEGSGTELMVLATSATVSRTLTVSSNTTISGGFTSIKIPFSVIAITTETLTAEAFDTTTSTVTLGSAIMLHLSLAQMRTRIPAKDGEFVYCTDCVTCGACVSTATPRGSYGQFSARSTTCQ